MTSQRVSLGPRDILIGMGYTTPRWVKWGLMIDCGVPSMGLEEVSRCHDLVAAYLEAHEDIAAKYRADQRGEVKYIDVLSLAESGDHRWHRRWCAREA